MDNTKNNLNMTFDWFDDTVGNGVKKAVSSFWENNYSISLASINNFEHLKDDPMLKGELFYTCQISIKNKQHITLRVTSDFIRIVFHDVFGSISPVFDLEKLTELERQILNAFFEHIVKGVEPFLIKETEQDKIDPLNKENFNFVFLIKNKDVNAGKLAMYIPSNRIEPKPVKLVENFTFDDFIDNFAYVDLVTGCAKISLNELKNLSKDDILILDKSNIKVMTLKTPTVTKEIKINPEPSIMLDVDMDEGDDVETNESSKEEIMPENKSMWDDIQIEVSAEFKKVKMTLGELKQISKGLVIDLGPVMNNEISLLVENKAVAKGELVIINDKYGVKISEVFANKKETKEEPKPAPQAAAAHPAPPPAAKPAPQPAQAAAGAKVPPPRPIPSRPAAAQQAAAAGAKPPQRPVPPKAPPKPAPKPAAPQGGAAPAQAQAGNKQDFDYSNFEE